MFSPLSKSAFSQGDEYVQLCKERTIIIHVPGGTMFFTVHRKTLQVAFLLSPLFWERSDNNSIFYGFSKIISQLQFYSEQWLSVPAASQDSFVHERWHYEVCIYIRAAVEEKWKKIKKIAVIGSRQCYHDGDASIFHAIVPENCSFRRLPPTLFSPKQMHANSFRCMQ